MSHDISRVQRLVPGLIEQVAGSPNKITNPTSEEDGKFSQLFADLINGVNDLQHEAGAAQEALMAGEPVELHEVMIKAEQSGVAMDLLLEIRNKLISAYSEVMRMPM
jgi:flagellar hook-basal body complex protein FliE